MAGYCALTEPTPPPPRRMPRSPRRYAAPARSALRRSTRDYPWLLPEPRPANIADAASRPRTGVTGQAPEPGSANHQDGPVGQVDHLVSGAAEQKTGQAVAPSRAHHDHASVVRAGGVHDL